MNSTKPKKRTKITLQVLIEQMKFQKKRHENEIHSLQKELFEQYTLPELKKQIGKCYRRISKNKKFFMYEYMKIIDVRINESIYLIAHRIAIAYKPAISYSAIEYNDYLYTTTTYLSSCKEIPLAKYNKIKKKAVSYFNKLKEAAKN